MASQVVQPAERAIDPKRLWFGFGGGAGAWVLQEMLTVFIASNSCDASGQVNWGGLSGAAVRLLLASVTVILLVTGASASFTAFRNWRLLAGQNRSIQRAEGYGPQEFMSLAGFVIGTLCTAGIFWAGVAVVLLNICLRAH